MLRKMSFKDGPTTGSPTAARIWLLLGEAGIRLSSGCCPFGAGPFMKPSVLTFPSHAPSHQAARVGWFAAGMSWTCLSSICVHWGLFSSWALWWAWPRSAACGVVQTPHSSPWDPFGTRSCCRVFRIGKSCLELEPQTQRLCVISERGQSDRPCTTGSHVLVSPCLKLAFESESQKQASGGQPSH